MVTSLKRNKEVAIFWDYENVKVFAEGINTPLAEAIKTFARSKGYIHIMRVYEDWAKTNKIIIQALYSLGFEPIQVSMGKTNSVDVKIAVDCIDCSLLHDSVQIFIIITGDKDFIPVVNWLKSHHKDVIIISNPENVSEHLIMSADDFISLEELSKIYLKTEVDTTKKEDNNILKYDKAVDLLINNIKKLREEGKSTRYAMIDNYMRSSSDVDYNGAQYVKNKDGIDCFESFSSFIDAVEQEGKIKTDTIEGFKEVFLKEENPEEESEFIQSNEQISKEDWKLIIEVIVDTVKRYEESETPLYKNNLLDELKELRKSGKIQYYNSVLRDALNILLELNFISILINPNGHIKLIDDHDENLNDYIEKAYSI